VARAPLSKPVLEKQKGATGGGRAHVTPKE